MATEEKVRDISAELSGFILDSISRGMCSEIPVVGLSPVNLYDARGIYYDDLEQMCTLGGWNITDNKFTDKCIIWCAETHNIWVEKTELNQVKIVSGSLSVVVDNVDTNPINWHGTLWNSSKNTWQFYLVYYDGTMAKAWKVTESAISLMSGFPAMRGIITYYGRLIGWGDNLTVYWSDAGLPEAWTGGSSGASPLYGMPGTVITTAVPYFDRIIVFTDDAIASLIGTVPANWVRTTVTNEYGCRWRDAVLLVGTSIFFLTKRGLSAISSTLAYGDLAVDWFSMQVVSRFVAELPYVESGPTYSKLIYSPKHKSFFMCNLSLANTLTFFIYKPLITKKATSKWTYEKVEALTNYNKDVNKMLWLFSHMDNVYLSSYKESAGVLSNLTTGRLSVSDTTHINLDWRFNLSSEVLFRFMHISFMRKGDSQIGYILDSNLIKDGSTFSKISTLTSNDNVRVDMGVRGRSFKVGISGNVDGGWVVGRIEPLVRHIKLLDKEV